MPAIAMLAAAVAAACCFLQVQSRHLDAPAARPDRGHLLDNDQWLSTVSQYDRDKYWNRFRDVSAASPATPSILPSPGWVWGISPRTCGATPEAGCGAGVDLLGWRVRLGCVLARDEL